MIDFEGRCTSRVAVREGVDYIRTEFRPEGVMRYSAQVKPISYLKANAADILLDLAERREPLVITQNGEAKAVLQDVASFEQTQETLALLKLLAIGSQDVDAGKTKPARAVVERLRGKTADRR
jgi:prevent-host-death family protein